MFLVSSWAIAWARWCIFKGDLPKKQLCIESIFLDVGVWIWIWTYWILFGDWGTVKETLRPILRRACWSLNLALQGRRPTLSQALECGFELNRKATRQAGTKLAMRFATTQFLGDWQWHVYHWALFNHYWKCGAICFRCPAARIPRRLG